MPEVKEISAFFDRRYPYESKFDFDNVGLLCGSPDREVSTVLVALDITTEVIKEASDLGAELIVSHHPVIFQPLREVLDNAAEGHCVAALLRANISAICLHTNLDIAEDGVNAVLAGRIGAKVESFLSCGCIASLPEPISTESFARSVRDALGAPVLRYADAGFPVQRIAICGGAGGELSEQARALGCDTVLTGEIHHHQWLHGKEDGINMIEAGHFETEHPVTEHLAEVLREAYPRLRVELSKTEKAVYKGL